MGDRTGIQWSDATWNPVAGCTRVSAGCDNCYAAREAAGRLKHTEAYKDLAVFTPSGRAAFNGKIRLLPERLDQPLRWRKPRRIFVNSMSDLFHEDVPIEFIAQVFDVMASVTAACGKRHQHDAECWTGPRHQFQVLTKRPERMREIVQALPYFVAEGMPGDCPLSMEMEWGAWPLPNVWLGTSVENQEAADERVPYLLATPAAVRFLSCEPLLGPMDLTGTALGYMGARGVLCDNWSERGRFENLRDSGIGWVIVGGESGPRARPCDISWIRSIVEQCKAAGVPVFVKQLGSKSGTFRDINHWSGKPGWFRDDLRDRKGGDPDKWPEDLRVREYPEAAVTA